MKNEFTPGPWTACELEGENKYSIVHNGPIAYVGENSYGMENCRANALLMASAPDLLAALEALHSVHRAFSSNDNWTSLDDDARAFAESAIARARGQSC